MRVFLDCCDMEATSVRGPSRPGKRGKRAENARRVASRCEPAISAIGVPSAREIPVIYPHSGRWYT